MFLKSGKKVTLILKKERNTRRQGGNLYVYMCVCVLVAKSCPTLCNPWTVAHKVSLFMRFPRPEDWSGLPFPSADLPNSEIKATSPALAGGFFTSKPPGKAK